MKRSIIILFIIVAGFSLWSCNNPPIEAGFEDMIDMTIYDYLVENSDDYSSFLAILEKAGIDKTLSAYNPNGIDYTLFLPDNSAAQRCSLCLRIREISRDKPQNYDQ
jgi:hypothetical protein